MQYAIYEVWTRLPKGGVDSITLKMILLNYVKQYFKQLDILNVKTITLQTMYYT